MKRRLVSAVVATCVTMGGFSTVAFADTTTGTATDPSSTTTVSTVFSTFDTKYQANVATEAPLLQQAEGANSTDATVVALLNTVQNIIQQTNTLYGVEQALYSAKSSIPAILSPQEQEYKVEMASLSKERQALLTQSNNEWGLVNLYRKKHNPMLLNTAIKAHNETQKKLTTVDDQMKVLEQKMDNTDWQGHPYDGGLAELQDSILKLQASAIHYTNEAIAIETAQTPGATTNG